MAKRVTDQEKELWVSNIRDGYIIDDIVAISDRAKSTIYKYIMKKNQITPKKQEIEKVSKIEYIDEWQNSYQDGMDWNDDPYEDMSISEKAAYEFIESGGCNGMSLWNSEIRRSLALNMMQYSNQIMTGAARSLKHMAYANDIEKWSRWLAPIAADWAITEGCETYDMARIYGLTAATYLWSYLHTDTAILSITQILSDTNKKQKESLRAQLFLAVYHYLGVRIAAHLKNNTNIAKFNTGDFSEGKQAFLLGYAHTLCGEKYPFSRPEQANICKNVIKVILPPADKESDWENRHIVFDYIKSGCIAAGEDMLFKKAKLLNLDLRHESNIREHLDFLIRNNYITINS